MWTRRSVYADLFLNGSDDTWIIIQFFLVLALIVKLTQEILDTVDTCPFFIIRFNDGPGTLSSGGVEKRSLPEAYFIQQLVGGHDPTQVSLFGNPRIKACLRFFCFYLKVQHTTYNLPFFNFLHHNLPKEKVIARFFCDWTGGSNERLPMNSNRTFVSASWNDGTNFIDCISRAHSILHLFETISDGKVLLSGTSRLISEERSPTFRCFISRKQS
jgi:hypothetical protein